MEYLIIALSTLAAASLTLFSGFGLGTILLPVFALFFPVDVSVALTAAVHFLNNLLKLALFARHASVRVLIRFGLGAIPSSFLGALALLWLSDQSPLFTYTMFGGTFSVMPLNLVVALLMAGFSFLELSPRMRAVSFGERYLVTGGILSGFFGGLSGHQGALRSAFLIRCNLSREAFIATGVVIACLVDAARLVVYGTHFSDFVRGDTLLLLVAAGSAFAGTILGSRLARQITIDSIRVLVSIMLLVIAVALGTGLI